MNDDPYVYPGTEVLRNLPGIEDPVRWKRAEADLTRLRIARLLRARLDGRYDLPHLQRFHHAVFCGFYEWAGELRTVDISRTAPFASWRYLQSAATSVFARLGFELIGAANRGEFLDLLSVHFGNVNALHPFREGNGRAQRTFFAQLAGDAGYVLDWGAVDPDHNIAASRASLSGDHVPLRRMLEEITSNTPSPSR